MIKMLNNNNDDDDDYDDTNNDNNNNRVYVEREPVPHHRVRRTVHCSNINYIHVETPQVGND